MEKVGLSPALGTFLAGVVLAESEYRHELEGDIEPFKGLLLGLFFISVGATIDFGLIAELPGRIAGLVVALFVVKMAVLAALARGFRLSPTAGWLFTFALSEGGEFAFVLVGFAAASGVFDARLAGTVNAVVALSMLVTPLVLMAHERWIAPRVAGRGAARAADEIPHHANPVVIAGYGRFGQIAGRLIRARGVETVVLDLDASLIDTVGRAGVKVYYGDAARLELLHAAGCARARLFILAVDEVEKSLEIAAMVRKHFPALPIIARARNREHYYGLRKLGIRTIIRETFGSALDAGVAALVELGHRAHQARRLAARFKAHDEETLEKQVALWDDEDETAYFIAARRAREEVAKLLRDDDAYAEEHHDAAWDTESLRAAVREREAAPAQEGNGTG
jgi:voltage-gated potassium channel Kch